MNIPVILAGVTAGLLAGIVAFDYAELRAVPAAREVAGAEPAALFSGAPIAMRGHRRALHMAGVVVGSDPNEAAVAVILLSESG